MLCYDPILTHSNALHIHNWCIKRVRVNCQRLLYALLYPDPENKHCIGDPESHQKVGGTWDGRILVLGHFGPFLKSHTKVLTRIKTFFLVYRYPF